MSRSFDKKNVILVQINEDDLLSFLVDKDLTDDGTIKCRIKDLAELLINTIPEYVFAEYQNPDIPFNSVSMVREAAKCMYTVKNRDDTTHSNNCTRPKSTKGDFGEVLLHLLLREFKETIPLVSKAYLKDSPDVPAHGFDVVHVSPHEKILWLGESKFYTDSKAGIKSLIEDLNDHINQNFVDRQFAFIMKNVTNNSIPGRDEWIEILNDRSAFSDRIKMLNIPMLCIYEHDIYNHFEDLKTDEAVSYHKTNVKTLKNLFDHLNNHPLKSNLNIILMLFPIANKQELLSELELRLYHMQQI